MDRSVVLLWEPLHTDRMGEGLSVCQGFCTVGIRIQAVRIVRTFVSMMNPDKRFSVNSLNAR